MTRLILLAAAAAALAGCSQPSAATCSRNADCPSGAVCASGICQRTPPSGGGAASVSGAGHLTSGTMSMDAVVGQELAPAGSQGTRSLEPANLAR